MFEKSRKTKKAGGFMTMIDRTEERFEKAIASRDEMNLKSRQTAERASAESAKLEARIAELRSRVEKMTEELRAVAGEIRGKEEKVISEAAVTESDLKAGRVSVREFLAVGKDREEILAEARREAAERGAPAREAIRKIRREIVELELKRAELQETVARAYAEVAEGLYISLKFIIQSLEEAGITVPRTAAAHERVKQARNEVFLVQGAPLYSAKTWTKLKSAEEVEELSLDPVVKEEHFENLGKLAAEIRGLEFETVDVHYLPGEAVGRPVFVNPKTVRFISQENQT
jgi:chromosome segregation ATPase